MSKVVTLGHVVQLAGGNMDNAAPLASHLEVKSIRVITLLLNKWREAVTNSGQTLLHQYCNGSIKPDENDVFPSVNISPDFRDCTGPLLKSVKSSRFSFQGANRKSVHQTFVKVLHRDK